MDESIPSIVWPAIPVILALAVSGTVFTLQKLKMLVCTHFQGTWTQRIPGWFWLVLSIVIPFGLVYLLSQQFAYSWLNTFLPEDMQIYVPPAAMFPTALGAIFGSGGSYALGKRLGLAADYSPGSPLDVTPAPEETPDAGGVPTVTELLPPLPVEPSLPPPAPATAKATLYLKLMHPSDAMYVLISDETGEHIYPVESD